MATIHCSIEHYHLMKVDELDVFAGGIKLGFYGNNPPFTTLPLTESAFGTLLSNFNTTRAAYKVGGLAQRTPFRQAKTALIGALDDIAEAVDKVANGDADIITLSGNVPTDGTKTLATIPGQPVASVKRGADLELITNCAIVPGAKHYGCIVAESAPLPAAISLNIAGQLIVNISALPAPVVPGPKVTALLTDLTDQREKHFTGLKHDVTYYIYYYCVNAAGVSILSEPISIVCW